MIKMSNSKAIAKNAFFSFLSNIFQKILAFFFVLLVARNLGVENFGLYAAVTAFPVMFLSLADPGLLSFLKRETAISDAEFRRNFGSVHFVKILLSFATMLAVFLALSFLNYSQSFIFLAMLAALSLALDSYAGLFKVVFFAKEKFHLELIISGFTKTIFVAGAIVLLLLGFGVFEIVLLMLFSSILGVFFSIWFFARLYFFPSISFDYALVKKILLSSTVLFALSSLNGIGANMNISLLSFFHKMNLSFAGFFGAATKLTSTFGLIEATLNLAVFPRLSRFFAEKNKDFNLIFSKNVFFQVFLILPVSTGSILLADEIISFFYGAEFLPASLVLKILAIQVALSFFNGAYYSGMIAIKKEKEMIPAYLLYVLINAGLSFLLVPSMNAIGAALAWLFAELILLLFLFNLVRKHFSIDNPLKLSLKPLASCLAMALFIVFFGKWIPFMPLVLVSGAIYFLAAFLLGAIDMDFFKRIAGFK